MFRMHNNRPPKSGERVDFRFSHFKTLQVIVKFDYSFYIFYYDLDLG